MSDCRDNGFGPTSVKQLMIGWSSRCVHFYPINNLVAWPLGIYILQYIWCLPVCCRKWLLCDKIKPGLRKIVILGTSIFFQVRLSPFLTANWHDFRFSFRNLSCKMRYLLYFVSLPAYALSWLSCHRVDETAWFRSRSELTVVIFVDAHIVWRFQSFNGALSVDLPVEQLFVNRFIHFC